MPLTMPPRKRPESEPREMVRVEMGPNDVRSFSREDAEEMMKTTPGAKIIGAHPRTGVEAPMPMEADDRQAEVGDGKAQRSAPNKARQSAAAKTDEALSEERTETKPAETKSE